MEPRAPLPISAAAGPTASSASVVHAAEPTAADTVGCPAIVALSEDHALLQALTVAIIEQAPVVTSPSVDRFIDQLVANSAEVALIDAATAPAPLTDFILTLRRQFPHLLVVLAGSAQLQTELAAQIADGTIFRFAHKPASAQRLKLFVTAALQSAARSNRRASSRAQGAQTPDQSHSAGTRAGVPSGAGRAGRSPWLWPLLLTATALGALAIGWFASGYAPHRHPLP
jgi:DNA-binding NarL/FixJ family response regulator